MTRKNNKGFSLIEIIIAIAILTLLLTPIMHQITLTFRTSRKAKEQQSVNESAIYSLEYFQKESLKTLNTDYSPVTKAATCDVYDTSGNYVTNVNYTAYEYSLPNEKIGAEKSEYTKQVVLDDLSSKLLDAGYKKTVDASISIPDFEVTNEGNIVHVDSATGLVNKVVCDSATAVKDPNEINLGNMQDMDKMKVAIINGDAAGFDKQAEKTFYSMAMDDLKQHDPDSWEQALVNENNDNVLNQFGYSGSIQKVTKVFVDKVNDAVKGDGYAMSVDVYYYNSYSFDYHDEEGRPRNSSNLTTLEYNVYSQTFYTDKCPDIYFQYQPYTSEVTDTSMTYSADDYILLDSFVDDVKMYLYKPFGDEMNARTKQYGDFNTFAKDESNANPYENLDNAYSSYSTLWDNKGYIFYNKPEQASAAAAELASGGTSIANGMIKIHVCRTSSLSKDIKIFTNIYVDSFVTDVFSACSSVKSSKDTAASRCDVADKDHLVESYLGDIRKEDRLYTITVNLTPVDNDASNNKVSLTGAKGEN